MVLEMYICTSIFYLLFLQYKWYIVLSVVMEHQFHCLLSVVCLCIQEGLTAILKASFYGHLAVLRTLVEQYGGNLLHRKKVKCYMTSDCSAFLDVESVSVVHPYAPISSMYVQPCIHPSERGIEGRLVHSSMYLVGIADSVLIREMSFIQSVLYREDMRRGSTVLLLYSNALFANPAIGRMGASNKKDDLEQLEPKHGKELSTLSSRHVSGVVVDYYFAH